MRNRFFYKDKRQDTNREMGTGAARIGLVQASQSFSKKKSRNQSRIKNQEGYYLHDTSDNKDPRLSPLC